jgi:hypothetical protein
MPFLAFHTKKGSFFWIHPRETPIIYTLNSASTFFYSRLFWKNPGDCLICRKFGVILAFFVVTGSQCGY